MKPKLDENDGGIPWTAGSLTKTLQRETMGFPQRLHVSGQIKQVPVFVQVEELPIHRTGVEIELCVFSQKAIPARKLSGESSHLEEVKEPGLEFWWLVIDEVAWRNDVCSQ